MRKQRIAIDLVPIRVGEGGTGSGIWSYARELLYAMDRQIPKDMELLCFVNEGQIPYLAGLRSIRLITFTSGRRKNIIARLLWVHLELPLACLKHKVQVLHKLATDTPFLCSAKRVTTVHDFYYEYLMEHRPLGSIRFYERLENLYFSMVTKTCFGKSEAIITVSNATRDDAIQRYPDAGGRIAVIHHGATEIQVLSSDTPQRVIQSLASCSSNTGDESATDHGGNVFELLCVAKFMEHKGQHLLIRAFEELLSHHPELETRVRLRLRGFHNDADYYGRICHMISSSRFASRMQLVTYNPKDGFEEIYAGVDLVILLSDYEGFGLPVLEAQSLGIPVLCSDLPVLREVGGPGAVYVNRDDVQQVVTLLCRFISDPAWYRQQQMASLENIKRFAWEASARKTMDIYRKVAFSA